MGQADQEINCHIKPGDMITSDGARNTYADPTMELSSVRGDLYADELGLVVAVIDSGEFVTPYRIGALIDHELVWMKHYGLVPINAGWEETR